MKGCPCFYINKVESVALDPNIHNHIFLSSITQNINTVVMYYLQSVIMTTQPSDWSDKTLNITTTLSYKYNDYSYYIYNYSVATTHNINTTRKE